MAQTTVSLYPKYMMGEALGGEGPQSPGEPDIGVMGVEVSEISSVLVTESLIVDHEEIMSVEVTDLVEIKIDVCN